MAATAIRVLGSAVAAVVMIEMDHREPEDDVGSSLCILPPCQRCIAKIVPTSSLNAAV